MALLRPRLLFCALVLLAASLLLLPHPQYPDRSILTHATGINTATFGSFVPSRASLQKWVPDGLAWGSWARPGQLEDELIEQVKEENETESQQGGSGKWDRPDVAEDDSDPEPEPVQLPTASRTGLTYHPNGYLLVQDPGTAPEPLQPHPILTLIKRGEERWQAKLAKSSKTLEECVEEYRRRYNRPPPFGFEKWWQYAVDNNVIIKDEYDQIFRDLMPFFALEPKDLHHRTMVMATERPESFTLTIQDGKVSISGSEAKLKRATDLADLLRRFAPTMGEGPPVNMTFTKHDQPTVQMTWSRKQKMWDMAQMGECACSDPLYDC